MIKLGNISRCLVGHVDRVANVAFFITSAFLNVPMIYVASDPEVLILLNLVV